MRKPIPEATSHPSAANASTDVPALRGIDRTAPYFHDNSAVELHKVVDCYSQFVLERFPSLNLPPVHPPEHDGPPESLTPEQKSALIAFLRRL